MIFTRLNVSMGGLYSWSSRDFTRKDNGQKPLIKGQNNKFIVSFSIRGLAKTIFYE